MRHTYHIHLDTNKVFFHVYFEYSFFALFFVLSLSPRWHYKIFVIWWWWWFVFFFCFDFSSIQPKHQHHWSGKYAERLSKLAAKWTLKIVRDFVRDFYICVQCKTCQPFTLHGWNSLNCDFVPAKVSMSTVGKKKKTNVIISFLKK